MANQALSDLINKLYGNDTLTKDYQGTIDKGYQNLNQPLNAPNTGREDKTNEFVSDLASNFADRVYQKTGQLPSEDQIRQFVVANATTSNASKFITGNLGTDAMSALSDQHIQGNPDIVSSANPQPNPAAAAQQRILGLNDQLNKVYDTGEQNYVNRYNSDVYAPAKTSAVNDMAAQGLSTQPTSRIGLNQIEGNRQRDISSGLNTLESNRAAGSVDLGKQIEQLLQGQQQITNQNTQFGQSLANNANQFNRNYNLNQDQLDYNRGLQQQQMDLSSQLGRLQAQNAQPGWDDKVLAGLGGLGSVANAYNAFKPKSTPT